MAKKHWIYVKRGLSESPKHRLAIGEAVWLFLHIIDRADWETGIVSDWRDKDEAADMGAEVRTLRDWRQRLENAGYISCRQVQHGQLIKIMRWINPRDYGAKVINTTIYGGEEVVQGDTHGDTAMSPSDSQGDTQGDTHVSTQGVTPSLYSESKSTYTEEQESEGFRLLKAAAQNLWGTDFLAWRKFSKYIEDAIITRSDGTLKIAGVGENAMLLQQRYARSLQSQLAGILNEEVSLVFEE